MSDLDPAVQFPSGSTPFSKKVYFALTWAKKHIPIIQELHPGYIQMLLMRLFFLLVFFIFSLWTMSASVVYAGMKYPAIEHLPDLGFSLLPNMDKFEFVTNTMLAVTGSLTILRLIVHDRGLTILRRSLFIYSLLLLGRSVTLFGTAYPDPSSDCQNYQRATDWRSFLIQSFYHKDMITCGDLMYSGHTIYFTMQGLIWTYYRKHWLEILYWIPCMLSTLLLISSRVHYTDDVILALYLTILGWVVYHLICLRPSLRNENVLVRWLELDIILWEQSQKQVLQEEDEERGDSVQFERV